MHSAITAEEVAARVPDGAVVMIGGCMGLGTPAPLIDAPVARGARGLTLIADDSARPGHDSGRHPPTQWRDADVTGAGAAVEFASA